MGASHPTPRLWLDVEFSEKEQAKALGARWDPVARRWWCAPAATAALQRWAARPDVPELLPGEDRTFGAGLFVDLVPNTCWFSNVRSCTAVRDWERLRRTILDRAERRCEVCGRGEDRAVRRWLEAHERWQFDDRTGVQHLRRLILLCSLCHTATHMGLAELRGHGDEAFYHLCEVTGMDPDQAQAHIDDAYAVWRARSARDWALDLSILTTAGIELAPPPDRRDRARIAADTLAGLNSVEGTVDGQPFLVPSPTVVPAAAVALPPVGAAQSAAGPRPVPAAPVAGRGGWWRRWIR